MYRSRKKFLPGCDNTIAISFHAFSFLCTSLYFGSRRSYSSGYFRTSSINFSFCMIFEKYHRVPPTCTPSFDSIVNDGGRGEGTGRTGGLANGCPSRVSRKRIVVTWTTCGRCVDDVWSLRDKRVGVDL